jgi:hypothetical protein
MWVSREEYQSRGGGMERSSYNYTDGAFLSLMPMSAPIRTGIEIGIVQVDREY